MTFKEWLIVSEQGTASTTTGSGAAGRAGQSQATPEMGVSQMPTPNANPMDALKKGPKTIPASAFNVSSKGKGLTPVPASPLNAGGTQPGGPIQASPLSPRGLGAVQPMRASKAPPGVNPIQVPKPSTL